MARIKDKKTGLTPQQELFCQYVVDAYGTDKRGVLVTAYRKAYNCKDDAKANTHYSNASQLMDDTKIAQRIEELQNEQKRLATISREELVSRDRKIMDIDPADLIIIDEKTGKPRMRYVHEIRKEIRVLLNFVYRGGRLVPDLSKDAANKRLIDMLGLASSKEVTLNTNKGTGGMIMIGFDDDEE